MSTVETSLNILLENFSGGSPLPSLMVAQLQNLGTLRAALQELKTGQITKDTFKLKIISK